MVALFALVVSTKGRLLLVAADFDLLLCSRLCTEHSACGACGVYEIFIQLG